MNIQGEYKPGDPRPEGYLAVEQWARDQMRGGLRQFRCPVCGLWQFPQEIKKCEEEARK